MEKQDIQKLRSLPIESVAARLGLKVEHHACLCPFHDDHTPSLRFNVARNTFKCFVCDSRGGVIDLAMRALGKGFIETCRWLADEGNVILSEGVSPEPVGGCSKKEYVFDSSRYLRYFEHPFLNKLACEFLFGQRKLHPAVIEWCRLTSWREWLQIPYFDINGRLTGVQWRNLGSSGPRFKFPYGSQCHIYNLSILNSLRSGEELYIAEGCSDCWALLSSGHKAIAIPSATLLKPSDLQQLSTLRSQLSTEFHMYPDQDAPGEHLYNQLSKQLTVIRHQLPSDCKDYSAFYTKHLCK